jgi:hypothetical protein
MESRSRPQAHESRPIVIDKSHPCWVDVRTGLEEAERGETIALTDEEADAWAKTGKLPERVLQWHDERSTSRRGT